MEISVERLQELVDKYAQNTCSREEMEELLACVRSGKYNQQLSTILDTIWDRQAFDIASHQWSPKKQGRRFRNSYWKIASVAAVAIIAFGITWVFTQPKQEQAALTEVQSNEPSHTNTYLTLPDSSTVILAAGSTLNYPAHFSGNTREVTLHGEAYFDVMPDKTKPFIIHSGKIKTTVLGTAFYIKMEEKTVTVTVTRGKVRVEDEIEHKQLAELLADEQLVYNIENKEAIKAESEIHGTTDWIMVDMVFTDMRFDDIVKVLEKRYSTDIRFDNSSLQGKRITATFDGTENLETVLNVLCGTHCAVFNTANGEMHIKTE